MVLSSCNTDKKKAIETLTRLKTAVESKDSATISALYPNVAGVDTLALSFDFEKLKFSENQDTLVASDEAGHTIFFAPRGKENMAIINSKGLLFFPQYRMAFAKGTGQYKDGLLDVELYKRMTDRSFDEYILQKLRLKYANPLSTGEFNITQDIEYAYEEGKGSVPVTNHTDIALQGIDYDFICDYMAYYADLDEPKPTKRSFPGKDIEPGQTVYMTLSFDGHNWPENFKILYHITDATLLRSFKPTGQEYEQYLAASGGVHGGEGNALFTGTKKFSGNIGKYSVNGTLTFSTGNAFTGEYGYKGRSSGINISGTITPDRQVVISETNNKGELCGTYRGSVNGSTISGSFTNPVGTQYNFNWVLQ